MNYTWVSSSKEQLLFSTNRKEIELYDKYGSMACEIPMEFWDMFGELEVISKKYNKLYREHFEDLKCYALMYYDIDLYQKEIDLVYKAFFVQKEQEIIGYKNRLINDTSLKSQVVQLYYKYEPILCSYIKARRLKRLNHKIKEGTNYSYESYISIKEGKFPKVCGIEQLTDNQCEEFLISQSYIVNNRISGNVNTFPSATKLNTKKGIIENFIIPCFFSSEWGFRREIIIEYISKKFNIDILGYVNLHKKQIQKALSIKSTDIGCYSDENIKRLDEEIKRLGNFYFNSLYQPLRELCCNFVEL